MSTVQPKLRDPTSLACPFPTVLAQEANPGWYEEDRILNCKAVLGSSLRELPDQNGPWGWEDWRGPTVADKGKLGPRKHKADSSVPMRMEPER